MLTKKELQEFRKINKIHASRRLKFELFKSNFKIINRVFIKYLTEKLKQC